MKVELQNLKESEKDWLAEITGHLQKGRNSFRVAGQWTEVLDKEQKKSRLVLALASAKIVKP